MDANSLYPAEMLGKLPYDGYKVTTADQTMERIFKRIHEKARNHDRTQDDVGYLIRCGYHTDPAKVTAAMLQYPPHISRMAVTEEMKSEHQRTSNSTSICDKTPKILTHLLPVLDQWLDGEQVQHLIEIGVTVDVCHEIVSYNQRPFLAPFVSECVKRRHAAKAAGDACRDKFMKNVINSLYGKHGQRKRNLKTFSFQRDYRHVQKNLVPRDDFDGCEHVGDSYLMTSPRKNIVLDAPMLVGSAILARSKVRMQRCFYDLCACYPEGAVRLMLSDTDSLVVEIHTEDYYADLLKPEFHQWRRHLDLSSYRKFDDWRKDLAVHPDAASFEASADPRHNLAAQLGTTEAVPSFLKDEIISKKGPVSYMVEVVAVRSKVYCYNEECEGQEALGAARAKGVPLARFMIHRPLTDIYRDVFVKQEDAQPYVGTAIRCRDFALHTVPITKKSISPHDDKFYMDADMQKWPYGAAECVVSA
jgi:hypothetical protein